MHYKKRLEKTCVCFRVCVTTCTRSTAMATQIAVKQVPAEQVPMVAAVAAPQMQVTMSCPAGVGFGWSGPVDKCVNVAHLS